MKDSRCIIVYICLILFINSFFAGSTVAQNGIPYISFLDSREGYEANNRALCQDDHHAMLFAGRKGLLRYDGSNWNRVNVPDIPHKIKQNPFNHKVYIISENDYGYLDRNEMGIQIYEPLTMEGELEGQLLDIHFTDSCIIFFGEKSISYHSSIDHQLLFRHKTHDSLSFSGMFSVEGETFVNILHLGLYKVIPDTIIPYDMPMWNADNDILFSIPHKHDQVLIGTSSNELLLFNKNTTSEFTLSNPEYLIENGLSGGLVLNDSTYAFSTSYGGVLLTDSRSGKIIYTLNYNSGMPDDEIYAMGKDQNNGLWLSYGFGTCRVDMNLKVKNFSHYSGIEGLYTNATWYKGELYIASTEGLFYLSEVKNYEEIEVLMKRAEQQPSKIPVEQTVEKEQVKEPVKQTEEPEETEIKSRKSRKETTAEPREKKNFFSRLFSRKNKEKETETEEPTDVEKANETEPAQKTDVNQEEVPAITYKYVRKKVSKLKSIEHVFKKVEGINSRCEQLIPCEHGLLVGSSSGLYLIRDHEMKNLSDIRNIRYISEKNEEGIYYILSDDGLFSLIFKTTEGEADHLISPLTPSLELPLFSIVSIDSTLWISGYDVVYKIQKESPDSSIVLSYNFESVFPEEIRLDLVDGILYSFSESSIHYYAYEADSFFVYTSDKRILNSFSSLTFFPSIADQHWLKIDQKMVRFDGDASEFHEKKWRLFENISTFFSHNGSEYWIIDDYSKIFRIDAAYSEDTSTVFEVFLESISNEAGENINLSSLEFDPGEKMINIHISAPSFLRDQTTLFQYKINEKMDRWSGWTPNPYLDILLDPGEYTVLVRARNLVGQISKPATISLSVRKPFYQTTWFYICLSPLVLGLFWLFFYLRVRKLRKDKRILEFKVEERTREIQKQKERIEMQKDEIMAQKDDITSSITYASRIQKAILPSKQVFEKNFSDYFVFYKPRDIVSGDFYWITEKKGEIIFAVADCTGHGVPGAFMSMLGNSFLNEITKETSLIPANEILDRLRDMVNDALTQSGENVQANDGMDISLCRYNIRKKELEYAGAYNSLFHIRKGVFTEYKADRMPIGYHPRKKKFKSHCIKMQKDDVIYLFSDGFQDQFGGPFSKKYTSKQFKQILTDLSPKPMDEQLSKLETELESWQGNSEQVDDVLIIGIRV